MTDYSLALRNKVELLSDFDGVTPPSEKLLNLIHSLSNGTGGAPTLTLAATGGLSYAQHIGGIIPVNAPSDITVTLAADWPVGSLLNFGILGAGGLILAATGGTVSGAGALTTIGGQFAVGGAWKYNSTDWLIFGSLV